MLLVHETDFQQTYPGHKHLDSVLLSVHGYCGPLLSRESHIYAFMYMASMGKLSQKFRWPSWIIYNQSYRQDAAESDRMKNG